MTFPLEKSVVCPVLVGRTARVEALTRLMEQARGGAGGVALLTGEAGVGKSRLAAEAEARAAAQGFTILTGRCFETDRAVPYAPLLDLLHSYWTRWPLEEIAAAFSPTPELVRLLPELQPLFPDLPSVPSLLPDQEKHRLFHALAQFFVRLTAVQNDRNGRDNHRGQDDRKGQGDHEGQGDRKGSPLLVVVEDLQWGDEASLEFLLYLARNLAAQPVLLLLTCRSDETSPALNQLLLALDRERLAVELSLHRLSRGEVGEMLRAIFELQRPIRAEFLEAVYGLTEGNPFFVEELMKALIASGEIFYQDGAWDRRPLSELHTLRVRTVQAAVQQRMDQLSPPARQVLTLAAVAGRRFDFVLLQQLSQQSETELVKLIKELRAAQLVVEESADIFAFRHALTRQAVYGDLLARERKALHRVVAETMERAGASSLADLAYHFYEAGEWSKAMDYAVRAGEQAQALYSPRTAVEHFTQNVGEWVNVGDSAIVNPDGQFIAGPLREQEGILYGEIDPSQLRGPKWMLDVAGHYARPDVFQLSVIRAPRPLIQIQDADADHEASEPYGLSSRGL